ncbi:16S rRNA (cytosine(1402)-N(4))-methyltransferase RsmH [Candidatus Curtissbacteria bacterium]|nr:16S rRNA (cytosine(1402)-N(4))-methyltransferase RsmH [Candidatus Curtissbacteria bacterium]
MNYHTPVLINAVLEILDPAPGKKYIDATLGGGGHTTEILKREAKVLGLDRDQEAVDHVSKYQVSSIKKGILTVVKANFNQIEEIAKEKGFGQADGVLFDLGVSSHQLDKAERGFSFQKEGALDMRMDRDLPILASDIINNFEERRIDEIIQTYGQEKFSRSIARAINIARQIKPIETTTKLTEIIQEVYRKKNQKQKLNPATRTFQALRIVVNSEILNLEESMPQTTKILKKGGRLVAISYHSLEDREVKRFFKTSQNLRVLTKKPIGPQPSEIMQNPRSRSAKLRAAEKL